MIDGGLLHPYLHRTYGATHFVGVAGVGLDAADPIERTDPNRRGILGYESSASLKDIRRGGSYTMLLIQVLPDSLPGFTPWIAGGGNTLRGVPDSKSIEPFLAKGADWHLRRHGRWFRSFRLP